MYTYILKDQGRQTNFLRGEKKKEKRANTNMIHSLL